MVNPPQADNMGESSDQGGKVAENNSTTAKAAASSRDDAYSAVATTGTATTAASNDAPSTSAPAAAATEPSAVVALMPSSSQTTTAVNQSATTTVAANTATALPKAPPKAPPKEPPNTLVVTSTPESTLGPLEKKAKLEADPSVAVPKGQPSTLTTTAVVGANTVMVPSGVAPAAAAPTTVAAPATVAAPTTAAAPTTVATNPTAPAATAAASAPLPPNAGKPVATMMSTTQLLLPDYAAVRQTVKDLLALLQLYGPLTANQLEYNLPPVQPAAVPWSVHDVLSILVAIGLVQEVAQDGGTTTTTAQLYCMHEGIPRADALLPADLPAEILQAHEEAEASWKRGQILRAALLLDEQNPKNNIKEVLKQILTEYPQVVNDPVYWTALRNCHIDIHSATPATEKRTTPKVSKSTSNKGMPSKGSAPDSSNTSKVQQPKAAPAAIGKSAVGVSPATTTTSPVPVSAVTQVASTAAAAAAIPIPTPQALVLTIAATASNDTASTAAKVLQISETTAGTATTQVAPTQDAVGQVVAAAAKPTSLETSSTATTS
jgi:hypothetical protein